MGNAEYVGSTKTNMPSAMMFISAAVLLVISLDYANAACQLQSQDVAQGGLVLTDGQFTILSAGNVRCDEACVTCGQTVATTNGAAGTGPQDEATIQAIGTAVCPTMAYTAAVQAAGTNCPFLGVTTAITVAAGRDNRVTAASRANVVADVGTDVVTNGVSPLTSAGGFLLAGTETQCAGLAAVATKAYICPCNGKIPETRPANCGICGCTDLGVPTNAPTAIPTTAPTAASNTSPSVTSSSDDSLSGGAIAGIVIGIVIGSVVGAALVIGAGVMIGSK